MTPPRLLLLAALAGCASPDGPPTVADVAGCYVLEWYRGDTVYAGVGLPDSVLLDSAIIQPTADHRRVAFAGLSVPSDTLGPGDTLPWYRYSHANHWRMGGGDSIQVFFNENGTQYETALRVRGTAWTGSRSFARTTSPRCPRPCPCAACIFPALPGDGA